MKKYNLLLSLVLLAVVIITAITIMFFMGGIEVKYDNDKSIDSLITEKYSESDIDKMRDDIEQDNLNYARFKSHFNVQCLRKTYQGYYAVFLQNDGKRIFVFMNEKMELNNIFVFDNIKKKRDYDFLDIGKTTETDVLKYDKSTVLLPVSSITCTAHIIQEGILIIIYDRFDANTGTLLTDPVVKSVSFYENSDFPLSGNEMINLNVPYILGKDKM